MGDFVSGIKSITPTYPVRPTQPAQKDRQPGGRKKKRTGNNDSENKGRGKREPDSDFDDKPTIDEHV